MLKRLSLRNFVLVEETVVEFPDGFLTLTGETGAGKSVVVGALSLIMGEPVRGDVLLDAGKPAWLEAAFAFDDGNATLAELCERHDVRPVDGELFFAKEIPLQGAARSFACGRRVNAAVIRDFRDALIDFTSQREQVKLFDPTEQLLYLDTFGGLLLQREGVEQAFGEVRRLHRELEMLRREESDREARIELYRYQAEELDALRLHAGEDDELESEFRMLSHADDILEIAANAEQELYESDRSVIESLQAHAHALEPYIGDCASCKDARQALQDAMAALDEAVASLRSVGDDVSVDRERLDAVEQRLDALHRIKQKYAKDLDGLLVYRQTIQKELDTAGSQKERIAELASRLHAARAELHVLAEKLTDARRKQARAFSAELVKALRKLAMPHATCEMAFSPLQTGGMAVDGLMIGPTGAEDVELRIAANPGTKPQPLGHVASGGELSRVLLALKQMLAGLDRPKTVIFDEIDAGIGGRTADTVGEFIQMIAKTHQVICITHLPQVAVYGKNQLAIEKIVDGATSRIKIHNLNHTERKGEIARMLAGSGSELAMRHAQELLEKGAEENHYDQHA